VIKKYVDQDLADELFEHTRMLKERKMSQKTDTTQSTSSDHIYQAEDLA
jgi:hypothetical protein